MHVRGMIMRGAYDRAYDHAYASYEPSTPVSLDRVLQLFQLNILFFFLLVGFYYL